VNGNPMRWSQGSVTAGCVAALAAASALLGAAQPAPHALDAATLRRSSFTWTQAEREFGFAHWDAVFSGRPVARGVTVRALPEGPPLAAFVSGTAGAQALARFIAEEKVSGLIVLQNGAVRLERYALGHSPAGRWTSQSVAKSVTSTLLGAAVKDGVIASLDDPVTKYIVAMRGSAYDEVTVRQLLTMTSGVRWNEDYTDLAADSAAFYAAPLEAGVNATVSYMRRLPRANAPGTKWVYKTGETHLLGVLITAATKRTLADYLSEKIWRPYGMEQDAVWMTDRTHHELAGCCLQVALRDYARFGQLVLDQGRIDGRSIVPEGWFAEATRAHVTASAGRGYGFQWWTLDPGTFAGIGIHGQLLYLDPKRRLVVAISSAWPEATSAERTKTRQAFLGSIAAAVDGDRKLP
jgi:CubicO group peptidase (beta-lactamase class C family)